MKLPFAPRRRGKTPERPIPNGVVLAPGTSGSSLLLGALGEAVRRFPAAFGGVHLPADKETFKRTFGDVLVRFEAHRAGSPERVAIAQALAQALHDKLRFNDGAALLPLPEYLARAHGPVAVAVVGGAGERRWRAEVPWRGEVFAGGPRLVELVSRLSDGHFVTHAGAAALQWICGRVAEGLDLRGQRFAVLGAGAELAPSEMLLGLGADVLWIDRAAPPERLLAGDFPGRLHTIGPADLLEEPLRVRQAILDFATSPVHLGLYAYAAGKGRELRLAAVMDAIAQSLPPGVAQSVSLLVSPTTPGEVQPEDRTAAALRRAGAQVWKKALEKAGILPANGQETVGPVTLAKSVVTIQGTSYQAAQYLAKMMAAEALLADGIGGQPVTVSANVAGITATRSLLHPIFQAGFLLAPRFGIEIFEPATTRALSTLLVLHDLLNAAAPGVPGGALPLPERARRMAAQSIHGGVRALPWAIEPTIRVAALIGLGKRPRLLAGLIPRRKKR